MPGLRALLQVQVRTSAAPARRVRQGSHVRLSSLWIPQQTPQQSEATLDPTSPGVRLCTAIMTVYFVVRNKSILLLSFPMILLIPIRK